MKRFFVCVSIAGIAAVAVTIAVADSAWLYAWRVAGPAVGLLGLWAGIRRHRPATPGPWAVLVVSLVLLWLGWALAGAVGPVAPPGSEPDPVAIVRDLLYVGGYVGVAAGTLLLVAHRTGGADRDNFIDGLVVVVALAIVLWALLLGGGDLTAVDLAEHERALALFSPLLSAGVGGGAARLLFAHATRLPSAWLLFVAGLLLLGGNLWMAQALRTTGTPQAVGADALWMLAFVMVAAAALHPSMRQLTEPVPDIERGLPVERIGLFGAALLAAPIAHLSTAGAGPAEVALFAGGGGLVVGLILWRMLRLLHEHERARRELAAVSRRDAIVAAIGEQALVDCPLHRLLADADDRLRHAVDGVRCAVVPAGASDLERFEAGEPALTLGVDDGVTHVADVTVAVADGRSLSGAEREFIATVATLLSAASRQRTAEARLRYQALHDDLTGLPGRTLALDRLRHLLVRRDPDPVIALFLDLDDFKQINDTFGHAAGDEVLVAVAERLRAMTRAEDLVARLAGDEFVVVVDEADPAALRRLVERLYTAAGGAAAAAGYALSPTPTVSLGVAGARPGEAEAEQLLRRADHAMYAAKQHGGVWGWSPFEGEVFVLLGALADHHTVDDRFRRLLGETATETAGLAR